jgi:hypothetical protein
MRHWKVEPASDELNAKLAEPSVTVPAGPERIDVSGGAVSVDGGTTSLGFLRWGSRGFVLDRSSSASDEPSPSVSLRRGFVCDW